ncbi:MAG: hypothetical protein IJ747_02155, partial [Lachnospiraceae bacterium]|nr:hypothetical protein [Lachnospiraceae bacterium]
TAEQFNLKAENAGINKRMENSGISTKTTNRIGDKALAIKNGTMTTEVMFSNMANAAKNSAAGAAGITAAFEIGKSIINGDDAGTCARNVVSKGAESAVAGAIAGATGEGAFMVAAVVCPELAIPAAAAGAIIGGIATGSVVDGAFEDLGFLAEDAVNAISDGISNITNSIENFFLGFPFF